MGKHARTAARFFVGDHKDRPSTYVNLGPHPPRLWPEDVARLTRSGCACPTARAGFQDPSSRHRGLALRRLEKELADGKREQVITDLDHELRKD